MHGRAASLRVTSPAFRVHKKLKSGLLEVLYKKGLQLELVKSGLSVETEKPYQVHYDETLIGDYRADLVVCGKVIVEIKAVSTLNETHKAQPGCMGEQPALLATSLINYLRISGLKVGYKRCFSRRGPKHRH